MSAFTIVEVLVVVVVIGTLAALSVNLFTNSQARGRDSQRQADIESIGALLEAYYNNNGKYPLISGVTPAALPGLTNDLLMAPGKTTSSLVGTATPTKDQYGYVTYTSTATACTSGSDCGRKFKLNWYSEDQKIIIRKESVN